MVGTHRDGDIWLHSLRELGWPSIFVYMHGCNRLGWHMSKLIYTTEDVVVSPSPHGSHYSPLFFQHNQINFKILAHANDTPPKIIKKKKKNNVTKRTTFFF